MLKTDIPVNAPSIWQRIDELRVHDISYLAPLMQDRVRSLLEDCKKIGKVGGELFDPILFESARTDELQQIYYQQGTTNAPTAIYGWHFFCLAGDFISASKQWSVKNSWWETLAGLALKHGLQAGYFWNKPDDPHLYFGSLKKSPSDIARTLYFGTSHWNGMKTFTDPAEHKAGLERVWKAVGAM